jgi:hypothetical protein
MFAHEEMNALQSRKQELLLQSEVNRRMLARDSKRLQATLAWADSGIDLARKINPAFMIAAPLLGFWLARRAASGSAPWGKVAFCWQLFRKASSILKRLKTRSALRS